MIKKGMILKYIGDSPIGFGTYAKDVPLMVVIDYKPNDSFPIKIRYLDRPLILNDGQTSYTHWEDGYSESVWNSGELILVEHPFILRNINKYSFI